MDNTLAHWGLSGETVVLVKKSAHSSSWNIGKKYVLQQRLPPDKNKQLRNIRLANLLTENYIPSIAYVKTITGDWTTPDGAYCLMVRIIGEHPNFYESPEAACELGRGLARLHTALLKIEPLTEYNDNDFILEWENYIKPGLVGVSHEIVEETELRFFKLYKKLPRCPIHRDVHSGNVLFHDGEISGWLDFELNRKDARVFDLAYFLSGLIVGKTDNPQMIETWKIIYRNLLTGYGEVNKLTHEETEILPFLMIVINLLFVSYMNNIGNLEERENANKLAEWIYKWL